MSGPKHTPWTPGPWKVGGDGPALWVEGPNPNRNVICDIVGRQENGEYDAGLTDEDEANAELIAAAPRLADALKELLDNPIPVESWDESVEEHNKRWDRHTAALDEARAALREAGVEP